jgi:hypothetical protein
VKEVLALRDALHDTGSLTRLRGRLVGCTLGFGICVRQPRVWCMMDKSFIAGVQLFCNAGDIKETRKQRSRKHI